MGLTGSRRCRLESAWAEEENEPGLPCLRESLTWFSQVSQHHVKKTAWHTCTLCGPFLGFHHTEIRSAWVGSLLPTLGHTCTCRGTSLRGSAASTGR